MRPNRSDSQLLIRGMTRSHILPFLLLLLFLTLAPQSSHSPLHLPSAFAPHQCLSWSNRALNQGPGQHALAQKACVMYYNYIQALFISGYDFLIQNTSIICAHITCWACTHSSWAEDFEGAYRNSFVQQLISWYVFFYLFFSGRSIKF